MQKLTLAAALGLAAIVPARGADSYGFSNVGLSFPFAAAIAKGFEGAAKDAGVTAVVLDAKPDFPRSSSAVKASSKP